MNTAIASIGVGIVVATLMSACQPQYPAPNNELRAFTQALREHGVTVTAPADLGVEPDSVSSRPPFARSRSWTGLRVWVRIEACVGVSDPTSCGIGTTGFVERPSVRVEGAEIRRFASMEGNRPRGVAWVTPDSVSSRTVVLVIGRTLGDSALVRRMIDTVQPTPE